MLISTGSSSFFRGTFLYRMPVFHRLFLDCPHLTYLRVLPLPLSALSGRQDSAHHNHSPSHGAHTSRGQGWCRRLSSWRRQPPGCPLPRYSTFFKSGVLVRHTLAWSMSIAWGSPKFVLWWAQFYTYISLFVNL